VRSIGSFVKQRPCRALLGVALGDDHTEPRLIAQAFVFACESKVTLIGDFGIYATLLFGSLVNRKGAPYKLRIHE
jgi:hypothetical protein